MTAKYLLETLISIWFLLSYPIPSNITLLHLYFNLGSNHMWSGYWHRPTEMLAPTTLNAIGLVAALFPHTLETNTVSVGWRMCVCVWPQKTIHLKTNKRNACLIVYKYFVIFLFFVGVCFYFCLYKIFWHTKIFSEFSTMFVCCDNNKNTNSWCTERKFWFHKISNTLITSPLNFGLMKSEPTSWNKKNGLHNNSDLKHMEKSNMMTKSIDERVSRPSIPHLQPRGVCDLWWVSGYSCSIQIFLNLHLQLSSTIAQWARMSFLWK